MSAENLSTNQQRSNERIGKENAVAVPRVHVGKLYYGNATYDTDEHAYVLASDYDRLQQQVAGLEYNLRGVTDALGITDTNDSPTDAVQQLQQRAADLEGIAGAALTKIEAPPSRYTSTLRRCVQAISASLDADERSDVQTELMDAGAEGARLLMEIDSTAPAKAEDGYVSPLGICKRCGNHWSVCRGRCKAAAKAAEGKSGSDSN